MKSIPFSKLYGLAKSASLSIETWPEGTVRLGLLGSWRLEEVSPEWFSLRSGRTYLVGRERVPPFRGLQDGVAHRKYPLLARHRAVVVNSTDELTGVVETLAKVGKCVDNDVYVFPESGGWLAYVSHHDEIILYTSDTNR